MSSQAKLPFGLPAPVGGAVDLLIVAGEHSGDEHAAKVVHELRAKQPGIKVCALGGPELAAAGAQLLHDLTATSVVGFVEVLKHYSFFKALFDATLRWIEQYQPRAVCFVDYPGFNLRLAAQLRERGLSLKGGGKIQMLYYISPQIWAWKGKRRFTMARDLDGLAVIFPFEPACYADTKLPVEFVGHPFLADDYAPPVRYDPAGPVLLLPGSRVQAVRRIFRDLLGAYEAYEQRPAVVLYPSDEIRAELERAVANSPVRGMIQLRPVGGVAFAASAVLTSSGTMSLHCALAGIPGAIAYRTNPLTYLLARWWVKIEYIGIANLLLKEPMYPEFIQGAATASALAAQLHACVSDGARRQRTQDQATRLRELLHASTSGTAADWLLRHLPPAGRG
ncbi:MAG TPA: lipid-A-disaccharide synthase [Candidatus Didemnitutus sp.]|nr:lipid-A-disaccharide synthase [Candidatus Didemnitutus sp.]